MMNWKDECEVMIADCEKRESRLTDWEREFIDSVSQQLADRGTLTDKQVEKLSAIWDRATADG